MGESNPWIVEAGKQAYEWEPIATLGNGDDDLPPRSKAQRTINANANLIAAAPEMRAAIRDFLFALDRGYLDCKDDSAFIDGLRTALNNADGVTALARVEKVA